MDMSDDAISGADIVDARRLAGRVLRRATVTGTPMNVRHFLGIVAGVPESSWSAIDDRLATLVDATCANVADPRSPYFECSECHGRMKVEDVAYEEPIVWERDGTGTVPAFCPVCGRRIVWDADEG